LNLAFYHPTEKFGTAIEHTSHLALLRWLFFLTSPVPAEGDYHLKWRYNGL